MQIDRVHLKNWGCFKEATYHPKNKIIAVAGRNGVGKSTFLDAVRQGITGQSESKNPIHFGEREAEVQLTFEDKNTVRYVKSLANNSQIVQQKFFLNEKSTTLKNIYSFMENQYAVNLNNSSCIVSTKFFSQMSPKELARLFFAYVPDRPRASELCSFLNTPTKQQVDFAMSLLPEFCGLEDIEQADKKLRDERTVYNRKKRELETVLKYPVQAPYYTKEQCEAELAEVMQSEKEALQHQNRCAVYNNAVQKDLQQKQLLKELLEDAEKLKSINGIALEEIQKLQVEESLCNQVLNECAQILGTLNSNYMFFENLMSNVNSTMCPVFKGLKCTTDKTQFLDQLKAQKEDTEKQIAEQKKKQSEFEEKLNTTRTQLEELRKQNALFSKKESILKQIEMLQNNPVVIPEKPIEWDSAQITQRKQAAMAALNQIERYERYVKAQDDYKTIEEHINMLNYLISSFAPHGPIFNKVIEFYLGAFVANTERYAEHFLPGYHIRLVNQDGIFIYCDPGKGKYIPFNLLSTGERANTVFLILMMLANVSNLRIIMLDEISTLDAATVQALVKLLLEHQDEYDHVFLAGVHYAEMLRCLNHPQIDQIYLK